MKYSVVLFRGFVLVTLLASANGYWNNKGKCLIQSVTQKTRKGNQPAWVWGDCDHTNGNPHLITTKHPVKTTMKPPMFHVAPQTPRPQPIPTRPPHPVPVPTRAPATVRPPVSTVRPQPPLLPAPFPTSVRPQMPPTVRPPYPVQPPQPQPVPTRAPATVRPPVSTVRPRPSPSPSVRPPVTVPVQYPQPLPVPFATSARPQLPPTIRPSAPVRPPQPPASVKPPMSTSRPTTTTHSPVKYWKNTWTTSAPSLICNKRWCWDGKMWFEKGVRPTQKTVNIFKKPTLP